MSSQRADGGIADAEMAERDAPPRTVIAERIFGLDDENLAVGGETGRRRQAGDAAADNDEVRALHKAPR